MIGKTVLLGLNFRAHSLLLLLKKRINIERKGATGTPLAFTNRRTP
jgi:hypothetical protein